MIDLSVRSRARVWLGTIAGTLLCIAAALFVDSFNFPNLDPEELNRSLVVDVLLPTGLAAPLLFLLLRKVRQLAIAHAEMAVLATTDSLTAVLNRGAFNMLVEAYLAKARPAAEAAANGSLLVIDADHFKSINDIYGHQTGDAALKLIANRISGVLRNADLVGRIGGEEFGVFLPGAARPQAMLVAERIRALIEDTPFPDQDTRSLTVSVGGVSFQNEPNYERLFKLADQCLYTAKEKGRNQVQLMDYRGQGSAA